MRRKQGLFTRYAALAMAGILALSSPVLAAEGDLPAEAGTQTESLPETISDTEDQDVRDQEPAAEPAATGEEKEETPASPDPDPLPETPDDQTVLDENTDETADEDPAAALDEEEGDPEGDDLTDPEDPDTPEDPALSGLLTGDDAFSYTDSSMSLYYDDRVDIDSTWKGYVVLEVRDEEVTSYKVEKGAVSSEKDEHILELTDNDRKLRASGTGTGCLILVAADDLEDAEKLMNGAGLKIGPGRAGDDAPDPVLDPVPDPAGSGDPGPGGAASLSDQDSDESGQQTLSGDDRNDAQDPSAVTGDETGDPGPVQPDDPQAPDEPDVPQVPVSEEGVIIERDQPIPALRVDTLVQRANLSVIYLLGQSNMEGHSTDSRTFMGKDSVVCEEGQVYSTYVPAWSSFSKMVSGISQTGYMQGANPISFVAESLTSDKSVTGNSLAYPLNQLSASRPGKGGMDGALAWKWNRLTGDKVWISNLAVGSTYVNDWTSGGTYFKKVLPAMAALRKVAEAERDSGHFKLHYRLSFWMQGEFDSIKGTSFDSYLASFKKMYGAMQPALGFGHMGIITTRYCKTKNYANAKDMVLDGVRRAQYYIGWNYSEFKYAHVVSDINEQWVSDKSIQTYYSNTYGGKFSYPLRGSASLKSNPTKISQVHSTLHYTQAGHNENGISAAQGMFDVVTGATGSSSYKVGSWFRSSSGGSVSTVSGDYYTKPSAWIGTWKSAGLRRVAFKGTGVSYNTKTGKITFTAPKNTKLIAYDTVTGKNLTTLTVNFNGIWVNGKKVYCYKNGSMKKGWQTVDSRKYYFKANGQAALGFYKVGKKKYYFFPSGNSSHRIGEMAKGWQTISKKKYYFKSDGSMATGRVKIGKKYYTFRSNGQLKK